MEEQQELQKEEEQVTQSETKSEPIRISFVTAHWIELCRRFPNRPIYPVWAVEK